jgi:sn-glycerol 3-phosphate transport system ATP-binding protein
MVFQNYALYPHMTVAENMGYALKVSRVPRRERRRKVEETAAILGLGEYLDRKPNELSGGQRQRVAMGRAIIREPQVFLFDEPLSNLDAKLRVQMRVEIRRLHRRLGATSIFVTHDQVEAMTLADRLIVMNGGLIEQVGRPADVYDRPATRFVGEFIGSPPMAFFTARTAEAGRLRLPDGGSLPMPPQASGLPAGRQVHAGVRAESLVVTTTPGPDTPRARVEFFEELGPARLLHLDLAGTALVAQVGKTMDAVPGSTVGVAAEAGDVHLFDPETGRALAKADGTAAKAA